MQVRNIEGMQELKRFFKFFIGFTGESNNHIYTYVQ